MRRGRPVLGKRSEKKNQRGGERISPTDIPRVSKEGERGATRGRTSRERDRCASQKTGPELATQGKN